MSLPPHTRRPANVHEEALAARCAQGRVLLVDDAADVREALQALLELEGYCVEPYASGLELMQALSQPTPTFPGPVCVLCDVQMPGLDGMQLQAALAGQGHLPLILISGVSGAREVATGFRAGAIDFLVKPIDAEPLLAAVERALAASRQWQDQQTRQGALRSRLAELAPRELEVARRVCAGKTNQQVAKELGIALRTVKLYRQRACEKLGVQRLPDLVRLMDESGL